MTEINKRYDFVLIFDVKDGNPNGDPDAGNLPRIDPETGHGIVTDVCLKRKVRNYVQMTKNGRPHDIYIKEKGVLGRAHFKAFEELEIGIGQSAREPIPDNLREEIHDLAFPNGIVFNGQENGSLEELVIESSAETREISNWIREESISKDLEKFINKLLTKVKPRKPSSKETEQGRKKMCQDYYDIRTFGAVLSLSSAPNCGQVRGPIQMTFARSVDPVIALEHSITRMAVATENEAKVQNGDNRTMGRKYTIPYGLYVSHGFVSAYLANQTGFSQEDLDLFWDALVNMFEHDRSAARGLMTMRKLVIFEHQSALGNAQSHELFERVQIQRLIQNKPPRDFSAYQCSIKTDGLLEKGIRVIEKPSYV